MLRKLLIAVVLLIVVLLVVVDRVGEKVAGHVLAGKLQTDEHLPNRPSVSIDGFPFLTQAVHGRYSDLSVTAHDFKTSDGVEIHTLDAHLHGVHVPLSKVISGSVSTVPVDHVNGSAFVSFDDLTRYLAGHGVSVTLSRATSGSVGVIDTVRIGRHTKLLQSVATVSVSDGVVTLSVAATRHLHALSLPIPLRALPFRIDVTSVSVGANGITGTGTANHVTLGS